MACIKHKVGDYVKLRSDLVAGDTFFSKKGAIIKWDEGMNYLLGKTVLLDKSYYNEDGVYDVESGEKPFYDRWTVCEEMFEDESMKRIINEI